MGLVNSREAGILEWYWIGGLASNAEITAGASQYVGLTTALPAENGTTTNEVSGGSYARATVTKSTFWNNASSGASTSATTITYPTATANWGVVSHFLVDSLSSGTHKVFGALASSVDVKNTDVVKFLAGNISIAMSGLWTYTGANDVLNQLCKSAATGNLPNPWYLGLSTTTPTVSGTNFTEPSGNGYARKSVAYSDFAASATQGDPTTLVNDTSIQFAEATGNWGTVTYWGAFSVSSGGSLLAFGQLTASENVTTGEAPWIAVNGFTLTLE